MVTTRSGRQYEAQWASSIGPVERKAEEDLAPWGAYQVGLCIENSEWSEDEKI